MGFLPEEFIGFRLSEGGVLRIDSPQDHYPAAHATERKREFCGGFVNHLLPALQSPFARRVQGFAQQCPHNGRPVGLSNRDTCI